MYTGIVQAVAPIVSLEDQPGYRRISLTFPADLHEGLHLGASVSLDGTCMSVVKISGEVVSFDAIAATLEITNVGDRKVGDLMNIERSAAMGQEISGHPMSGHVFGTAVVTAIETRADRNYVWFRVPEAQAKYIFPKGFLGLNGVSLTVAEQDPTTGAFKVNFIPDTLRRTSFPDYKVGDRLNFEIEMQTMIIVDTLERVLQRSQQVAG